LGEPDRPLVPVLVGPTGVGKTAVAAALGARALITVISADARQVYRGLDLGTAKPPRELQARIPHLGLDLIEPGERYSAGRFARDAAGWLASVWTDGREPVVVGGTGFYVRALAEGLFREPPLDPARRERLRTWGERLPVTRLAHWAALLTGRALSWWQREVRETGIMRPWYIHLTLPRDALHRRITERVDRMLAAGLVAEVRAVLARGVATRAPGLDGVGYREVVATLEGRLPQARLRDAIVAATRRYAKRQETWFRNQLRNPGNGKGDTGNVWTLDATETPDVLATRILERWQAFTFPVSRVPSPER